MTMPAGAVETFQAINLVKVAQCIILPRINIFQLKEPLKSLNRIRKLYFTKHSSLVAKHGTTKEDKRGSVVGSISTKTVMIFINPNEIFPCSNIIIMFYTEKLITFYTLKISSADKNTLFSLAHVSPL